MVPVLSIFFQLCSRPILMICPAVALFGSMGQFEPRPASSPARLRGELLISQTSKAGAAGCVVRQGDAGGHVWLQLTGWGRGTV